MALSRELAEEANVLVADACLETKTRTTQVVRCEVH